MANVIYTFTGASQSQVAAVTGTVGVKLWAGAGGGALRVSSTLAGGAGGFVQFNIDVIAGDVLRVDVGGGGKAGKTGVGGLGGWPNGGFGARTSTRSSGGGGGRTAFYVNGVLVAVAGAGGGHGGVSTQQGGAGANPKGEDSYLEPGTSATTGGTGGTQTTGGVDNSATTNIPKRGGSLFGGRGGDVANNTTITTDQGGGGGDGYFGGGGGGNDSQSGGGGSSWVNPAVCYDVTFSSYDATTLTLYVFGSFRTPWQEQYDLVPEYVAGVALGGTSSATSASTTDGGNGWARIGDPIPPNEIRTSGSAVLVLGVVGTPLEASGLAVLTLGTSATGMRVSGLAQLALVKAAPCVSQRCQVWTITRRDGVVLGFTSHDEDVMFRGVVHKRCGSLNPSASENAANVGSVGIIELEGLISSDEITEEDLFGGLYDDAYVEVWLIPWGPVADSSHRLAAGWTGALSQGDTGFRMEVLGPGSRLEQQALVEVIGPGCRWVFGSPQCGIDIEALSINGVVTFANRRGSFLATLDADTGSQWPNGRVRFTSGPNDGQVVEVKSIDFGTGQVVLWASPAYLSEPGDTFDVLPGCDQILTSGCTLYANQINFGGFPAVPGDDSIMETPDAKY